MAQNVVRFNVSLPADLAAQLADAAHAARLSQSAALREALALWLAQQASK